MSRDPRESGDPIRLTDAEWELLLSMAPCCEDIHLLRGALAELRGQAARPGAIARSSVRLYLFRAQGTHALSERPEFVRLTAQLGSLAPGDLETLGSSLDDFRACE